MPPGFCRAQILLMKSATIEGQKSVSVDIGATFRHPCDYCYQHQPCSFYFSVLFKTVICLTNKYLFETTIPNNTFNLSLFSNHHVPNTLYPSPCLLCTLNTKPNLLCRLYSTIFPRYAVSSKAWHPNNPTVYADLPNVSNIPTALV